MNKKKIVPYQDEQHPVSFPFPEKLRSEHTAFKVPDSYFDTLGSRIMDRIQNSENKTSLKSILQLFRKPIAWAPLSVTAFVVLIFIFLVPTNKESVYPATDELSELIHAYDASYAEEVFLAESLIIDNELENIDISSIGSAAFSTISGPDEKEISEYLKEQEIDLEILNAY